MSILAYALGIRVIHFCWIIFIAVWLLAAISAKRTVYRERRSARARYWLLLVIAYVLLQRAGSLPYPLDWLAVPHTEISAWIGAFVCISGLAFALWARGTLGRNWSGAITLKEEHELIEEGPYRIVRHPIYAGILAMFAGTAIAIGYLGGFIGLVLLFGSFWIKLKREEDLMREKFPERYFAYQCRVKRIIPFVV